jgi:hypothetical protein
MNTSALKPQYITDDHGRRTAVILPIDVFEELLEDFEDLAAMDAICAVPTVSHQARSPN